MIHLDLSFVQEDKNGLICILLKRPPDRPTPFIDDAFFFPLLVFCLSKIKVRHYPQDLEKFAPSVVLKLKEKWTHVFIPNLEVISN